MTPALRLHHLAAQLHRDPDLAAELLDIASQMDAGHDAMRWAVVRGLYGQNVVALPRVVRGLGVELGGEWTGDVGA